MREFWGWYTEEMPIQDPGVGDFVDQHRRDLPFWATLSATQRRAALHGSAIPVARMNMAQRAVFATALTAPPSLEGVGWLDGPDPPRRFTAQVLAGGAFAATEADASGNASATLDGGAQEALVPRFMFEFRYYVAGQGNPVRTEQLNGSLIQPQKLLAAPPPR
jgi:hypothetical protein